MKYIYASQRIDISETNERRDCLDRRWAQLLYLCGLIIIPVPNHKETLEVMLKTKPPDGILLTGGNSPVLYGGDSPQRDETDNILIDYAVSKSIPLLGVCRGMQSIIMFFGGSLMNVSNHVAVRHIISGDINCEVNSYHTLALEQLPEELKATAYSGDNIIEAVEHLSKPIKGIMWHPEREEPEFNKDDVLIIKEFFYEG